MLSRPLDKVFVCSSLSLHWHLESSLFLPSWLPFVDVFSSILETHTEEEKENIVSVDVTIVSLDKRCSEISKVGVDGGGPGSSGVPTTSLPPSHCENGEKGCGAGRGWREAGEAGVVSQSCSLADP